MPVHLLGIRHHGPGSCRNVLEALEEIQPDIILLEGPPEATPLLPFVAREDMRPPVALLAYQPDSPQNAVFYPFAEFSPEWQTMRHALQNNIPLRFFDLPLIYAMALESDKEKDENTGSPFDYLGKAAGYDDGEAWWETTIEQRKDSTGVFLAVKETMAALREAFPKDTGSRDLLREAWMRKMIRGTQKEGYERIAVVCGAWHVPALDSMPKVKDDNERLKGLAKVRVECTWIPWTYDRLSLRSGYGAGIDSPGWYDCLWHHPKDDGILWVSCIAEQLRRQGMDISVAHVMETVRLAQTLTALRGMASPSLSEYHEAVTSVMGMGEDTLWQLIREPLIIGRCMGCVPDGVPKVPLLADVERMQKKLRVPFSAQGKELTLDLRKPNDLERSIFFHRLALMDIDWPTLRGVDGKGTFKEQWTLHHRPEQVVALIEKAVWGNTLEEAVRHFLEHESDTMARIPQLTELLNRVIPADLPSLIDRITDRLDALSAASSDMVEMLEALPHLAEIVRYGNVRQLDFSRVGRMLHVMMARVLAGGVLACVHLDDEAASALLDTLSHTDYAVSTLSDSEMTEMWLEFVKRVRATADVHPLLSGYATRLLRERNELTPEEVERILGFYTSSGNEPSRIASWLEGFLHGSGTILLLDDALWNLVNNWVCGLEPDHFLALLPVLRRTFSQFAKAERRKIGEKARTSQTAVSSTHLADIAFNSAEAARAIPVISLLLGIPTNKPMNDE